MSIIPIETRTQANELQFVYRHWKASTLHGNRMNNMRWPIARTCYKHVGKRDGMTQRIANAIYEAERRVIPIRHGKAMAPTDTVELLAKAYSLFHMLAKIDLSRARKLRRIYGYTKWAHVYRLFEHHEFEPEKAFDYLELEGDNIFLSLFAENAETNTPEWERTAYSIYKKVMKLQDDFGVDSRLREKAIEYIAVFDEVFPPVKKGK